MLHSMGGPMMMYFLKHQSQQWKEVHIHSVISLAGAWGGSIKALKVYAAGEFIIVIFFVKTDNKYSQHINFHLPLIYFQL